MEAIILAISSIQVMCPEDGSLCVSSDGGNAQAPLIYVHQSTMPVCCLKCGKTFSLPKLAFVYVDLRANAEEELYGD